MALHLVDGSRRAFAAAALAALAVACGSGEDPRARTLELAFEARFDGQPLDCSDTVGELGVSQVSASPLDFRFFVHDVGLMRSGGEVVPLELADDGVWQRDGVALLDFEDGTGTCETGSEETNFTLRGTAPQHPDYTGVVFTLGVPAEMNHLDAATAPAPFNAPGMWWSWQGGYKYARIDVATEQHPGGFFFHLGGTNCDGSPSSGFDCQYENTARIELSGSGLGPVVLDAAALYRELDLEQQPDFMSDFVPGCMAFAGDPECPAMFGALGLAFEGASDGPPPQSVFEME